MLGPIAEFNLIQTNKGDFRGFHYHKEFNEWVLVTSGQLVYFEYVPRDIQLHRVKQGESQYPFQLMGPGDCILFPIGTSHTMKALTDVSIVAMLSKRWEDCKEPITRVEYEPLEMDHVILKSLEDRK
jgi:quercetin dioxygenase-like cupin family protein